MNGITHHRLLYSIAFLSAAIIAFQLSLIQILSNVQWYHFAYMVISVALLGFGAAGTVIALFRKILLNRVETLLPLLMTGTGVMMVIVPGVSQFSFVRFDSYLLFAEYSHIGKLLLTYLLFFMPFFLGALAIGLVFVKYVNDIGRVYFANLFGSGAGGMILLLLIWQFYPNQLPPFIAILPVMAALIIIPRRRRMIHLGFAIIALAVIAWKAFDPVKLVQSEYKDLSKTLLLPEAKITFEKTSPYGVIQTVSSPVLRYGPGMSLTAEKTALTKMAVFTNGDWFGAITDWKRSDSSIILDYTTLALPYIMSKRNDVLVLRSAIGIDVAHAFSHGANKIVAVEPNSVILSMLKNELIRESDSLFIQPQVSTRNIEPRTFLLMDTTHYDLITIPIIGTFGGSSGLHALQEQFLLTKEAFRNMWYKLKEGGAISVTSWMDYPVRNPLKVLGTLIEVLTSLGIKNPGEHIAAIRSWGTITFVITKSELRPQEITNIRNFCEQMMFDPAILPGLTKEERTAYNQFQDDRFFDYVEKIISPDRTSFYSNYDFNIKPATDNKPYFSQYIRWSRLQRLAGFFGNRSVPFFEIGYLLVIITFIQITLASLVLIILPLFKLGWKGKNKLGIVLYFTGIGIGYMFVEMVFIQQFILYFGNPVYSASAIITSLLIFSGLGSFYSNYFTVRKRGLVIFGAIISILILYSIILAPLLQQTIHLNLLLKSVVVFLVIAPLAFCMGIPFPAGLSRISKMNTAVVPWAWGINGCISVISAVLATMISVEMGFTWVMVLAAVAYCLSLIVHLKWHV